MFARLALAATLAFSALPAAADTVSLTKEMQAASLHVGGIDMVVYYVEQPDHFEVVATYATQTAPTLASRFRMGLSDGDAVAFAMPGKAHVTYSFARSGDGVEVGAEFVGQAFTRLYR